MSDYEIPKVKLLKAASLKDGIPISINGIERAWAFLDVAFIVAKNKVSILNKDLTQYVYSGSVILSSVDAFLANPENELQVLIEPGENLEDNPFYNHLKDKKNASFRELPQEVAEQLDYNFTLIDSDSYRYQADKYTYEAIAVFNGYAFDNLSNIFNELWQNAKAI